MWSEEVSYPLRPRREKKDTTRYSEGPNGVVFSHWKNTVASVDLQYEVVKRKRISLVVTRRGHLFTERKAIECCWRLLPGDNRCSLSSAG